jgi:hypothetical protein
MGVARQQQVYTLSNNIIQTSYRFLRFSPCANEAPRRLVDVRGRSPQTHLSSQKTIYAEATSSNTTLPTEAQIECLPCNTLPPGYFLRVESSKRILAQRRALENKKPHAPVRKMEQIQNDSAHSFFRVAKPRACWLQERACSMREAWLSNW